jgi:hypothetical protein
MSAARSRRRRPRAMAARQALRLCEANLAGHPRDRSGLLPGNRWIQGGQHRVTTVTTRAALRAAGLPPDLAATLRSRLRLIPEQEARR